MHPLAQEYMLTYLRDLFAFGGVETPAELAVQMLAKTQGCVANCTVLLLAKTATEE